MRSIKHILVVLFCLGTLPGFSTDEDESKWCFVEYQMDSVKVKVINGMGHRRYLSRIWTYVNNKPVDSIYYTPEAVGGYMGISLAKEVNGHLVFSKFGDYNGRTLIVDGLGQIRSIIGANIYYDPIAKYLFSIWGSDEAGFSVYDLEKDSLLIAKVGVRIRPSSFHKIDNQYYVLGYDDEKREDVVRQFYLSTAEYGRSEKRRVGANNSNKLQSITNYPETCPWN
jgi:hypothetical protein